MLSFILGCIIIAVIVSIGWFFLRMAFILVMVVISMIFSFIGWIVEKVTGK